MSLFSKQALSQFSELDYEIYNFILKNSEKIAYMTIREMANEAHVSTTTITRFCRKLNCDGFSEFKVRYKLEAEKSKNHQRRYDFSIVLDFLQRANTQAFQNQLDKIATIIASKK
ncbi:MurR/RpiR family transcriptional regulator [Abyssisolibacter fermentans]|uniref:MurR/RpiR family transcriptional regulator n=1 Tax=Abyssisolibacter fermentans TaxID=1766203 RepID=UPI00082B8C98|nr:MurR/RpiR family transcriptional regulator [Abyssisolibacter fermentans]